MRSAAVLSAVALFGASVVSAATCTKATTITEPTPTFNCDVVDAIVTVDESVAGNLVINGPKQLKQDLIISNATKLISLSSTTINAIGGKFQLQNLEFLATLEMGALRTLNEVEFIKLTQLSKINFGSNGVTKVNSIRITDTFISDLSGLSVASIENFQINDNSKLTKFNSDLVNITGQLIINNNGNNMEIDMPKLEYAAEIQISDVKTFNVPALAEVSESIKFDSTELESFSANNLTKVNNDVSFINNKNHANISMPLLESIGGGLAIKNNTALETIDGFPLVETVSGGIDLLGDFNKVELPSLKDVKGSVNVQSSTDISNFCDFFFNLQKTKAIQGSTKCRSNNDKANEGVDGGQQKGSSGDKSKDSAAGSASVNMALLGVAGVAILAQLF
jgi:hypothetical protein